MRSALIIFLVIVITSISAGCGHKIETVRINNVVRVFWHEGTRYSVQVREPGSTEIKTYSLHGHMCTGEPRIFTDVLPENSMWVKYVMDRNWDLDCLRSLEIHVWSETNIEGGGWDHGKFGHGQTYVIK
ncbi:MAG: hypothetical protein UT43_C0006G0003 [Parcubacteria group bacterium GW2011_GWC1_39_29]|nr:MAG: hypothetical protein UT43_C0006G0003 [Parcubacteria group bacterium GW2011_GWC1_39_29]